MSACKVQRKQLSLQRYHKYCCKHRCSQTRSSYTDLPLLTRNLSVNTLSRSPLMAFQVLKRVQYRTEQRYQLRRLTSLDTRYPDRSSLPTLCMHSRQPVLHNPQHRCSREELLRCAVMPQQPHQLPEHIRHHLHLLPKQSHTDQRRLS